ncbi:enoyl-CoA hydratase/isomerase family protein [Amycolatopsis eburnea]|uniref:Enoyl-CoA hydratase/isomerase family protein n=1 Tax=Amycolatopsis eburnea TaxID=2267691 RepID=A0A3R9DCW7_9PSEU|nr:enoyl-CoA hydratase/isomerase family protein [Amycolatopsis eburnea]RSD10229.1 enoyl-CoA hydratase/isomerase family protein [Amycolatopsis eburnea]
MADHATAMSQVDRAPSNFPAYKDRYKNIRMDRTDGILEVRFHTDDGPLQWSLQAHAEFEDAFLEIGRDRENDVVILTGTGDAFSGPAIEPGKHPNRRTMTPESYDPIQWEGKQLLPNLLSIEAPVIAAINGPAVRHAEIPLVSDVVLASEDTYFQDTAHFPGGMVPGDGMHIVMPLLMGPTRGRYFLFTGQRIGAAEARDIGLVNEVLTRDELLPRARELARLLLQQPRLVRRYSRTVLTEELRQRLHGLLGYGLALEGLARMKTS